MAKNRNPLIGTDAGETIESVRNVLEFLQWHELVGENTAEIEDGRQLVLACCTDALSSLIAR